MKKSCKKGYYYCFTSKKCKKIPVGHHVMGSGRLMKDSEHEEGNGGEESTETTKNGKTNGNGNGGAVSEGWSEKYKKSIDCKNPKGFSQRAHCQGRKVNEAKEKGDHEISMAQSQLKKSEENIRKLRKALGKKERNIPAWVQAKITDTEHNTDAASTYMDEGKRDGKSAKDKDYSLRDWFKGGGWVQAGGKYDGKPCAKQPGQKTKPFCRDADDRAAMSKEERNKRAKKKRKEDPNPNRKGKAKIVTAEAVDATKYGGPDKLLQRLVPKGEKVIPSTPKKSANLDKAHFEPEGEVIGEKKDACYKKVKARYDVWPSAYASGALVKCRKVGAANWGNKTKKESYEYSNWRDDFKALEIETIDLIKPEPLVNEQTKPLDPKYKKQKPGIKDISTPELDKQPLSNNPIVTRAPKGSASYSNVYYDEETVSEKCWVGYKQVGMKKKGGKMVPNCVKERYSNWREELSEAHRPPAGWKPYGGNEKGPVPEVDATANRIDAIRKSIKTTKTMKEDWQKVNKGDKTDGMSPAAVKAYRRENPGSKLKTAVTGDPKPGSKDAKRRKSFCSRSKGQQDMHNIDCSKTPDKAICKARRRWKC